MMKKIVLIVFAIIALAVAALYIFIPQNITVSNVAVIPNPSESIARFLANQKNWEMLIPPGTEQLPATAFSIKSNDIVYTLQNENSNPINIQVKSASNSVNSILLLAPISKDTCAVEWSLSITAGLNPLQRIRQYTDAVALKKNMTALLSHFTIVLGSKEKVYGVPISITSTKDTFLLATKSTFPVYPGNAEISKLVKKLQVFIAEKAAEQTNVPIMNVSQLDQKLYQLMVAIPINKKVSAEGDIFFRRMVPGNFVVTEVKGGNKAIDGATNAIQLFITDYRKTVMALPFQALITDRSVETDTARWITKLYFPVAY
jgi:hypothetical protein